MTKVRKRSTTCADGNGVDESSSSQGLERQSIYLDHEIAQITKLSSGPHKQFSKVTPGGFKLPVSTVKMLGGREANYSGRGRFSLADKCHILSRCLPVVGPTKIDCVKSRAYVSQFSMDGTLFVAGFQGSLIRIYNVNDGWRIQKDILAKSLQWTITDTSLSPDQQHLVYASMSPVIHIVNVSSSTKQSVANVTEIHDGLDFSEDGNEFAIFSVKFSMDGKELVAASNDNSIYIYDLESNRLNQRILAHTSDVNTVCFADETGHLMYSGSDDRLCKVWDRRCFRTKGQEAGILMGHCEGITFIDSRGDGRYFISNGKDQAIKLWDIRKMSSSAPPVPVLGEQDWDYRWMEYPDWARNLKHPHDQSLATYKGHSVLRTLIRCYFSPLSSTGQKYIYSGSNDCAVYIYDLVSGAQVKKIDYHTSAVRDCSWHPLYPMIVSSSWDGSITKWEFRGEFRTAPLSNRRRTKRRFFN